MIHKLLHHIKEHKYLYLCSLILIIVFFFSLPRKLFPSNYSTVVLDQNGELLGARIAADGQWRFPESQQISDKYKECLIAFEDRHFLSHPGVNPLAIGRAAIQNLKAKHIVSGGSTLSMQLVRMYRNKQSRNIFNKLIEIVLSARLELKYSKNQILLLYASHAPFGGNVVGVDAASWRYFGRPPHNLSWAEAALLAVLPNSPSLIHPGKNRNLLERKRNRLLKHLLETKKIDPETYRLSLTEPIPERPLPMPDFCPQYTEGIRKQFSGPITTTHILRPIQENANRITQDYFNQLQNNGIENISAVIIEVKTGNILTYIGNVPSNVKTDHQDVDCADAPRSTGSVLKPILFMAMQNDGLLLPTTLVADLPTRISGFKPENYDLSYDGAVPAKRALARSLNIPCVRMLQEYGIPKFENLLKKLGMSTLTYPPDHYGLTLVVGGAEGKLIEIARIYAALAQKLNQYPNRNFYKDTLNYLNYASIYLTFEALLEVNRPDEESGWKDLSSSRRIAWKTGTSYGFRDAWAIGTTPEYVVGVWTGNADGEGRPGLTGVSAAAPLMFRLFNLLPQTTWFKKPYDDLEKVKVCKLSGYKAGEYCTETDSVYISPSGTKTATCPYHIQICTTPDLKYRVNSHCYDVDKMTKTSWFVLPPAMEWFYRKKNIHYKQLPKFLKGCSVSDNIAVMELIYPLNSMRIFVPKEMNGQMGKTVFELAHRNADAEVFWHVDNEFLGSTKGIHQIAINPLSGKHLLSVVDNEGNSITRWFEVVNK
jgi:penicillin-binding protein 1C